MASGYGLYGRPGRCYTFWLEFSECMDNAGQPRQCKPFQEDYLECLHHHKEHRRYNSMTRELERRKEVMKAKLQGTYKEDTGHGHGHGH